MMLNIGKLTAAQIDGPAPFPCLIPAIGVSHVARPAACVESPNAVQMWWFIPCIMANILWTDGVVAPSWHRLNAAASRVILS